MKSRLTLLLSAITACCLTSAFAAGPQPQDPSDFWGARYHLPQVAPPPSTKNGPPKDRQAVERLRHWNETAVNASGLDHTPGQFFGAQLGPVRASRAIAIVHIAVF